MAQVNRERRCGVASSVHAGGGRPVEAPPLADLHPAWPLGVYAEGQAIALYRVGDVAYAAPDLCSHMEASSSEGRQDGYTVTCPRHGGPFDIRTGTAVRLPPTAPSEVFPVEMRGGRVWIGLPGDDCSEPTDPPLYLAQIPPSAANRRKAPGSRTVRRP
jgi:nitrite reductase/ring-hydroxylating ferredoxin subunit